MVSKFPINFNAIFLIIFHFVSAPHFCIYSFSQTVVNPSFSLETKAHYGFIIPHRTGIKNLIQGHVKAFEINYDIPTYGTKEWQQLYNFPTYGLSYYFADLGNPRQLGLATGIFPYINFPSVKLKKFSFNYHVGWGLGYISRKFNRTENHKNIMIGSKINAIISFGTEAEYKLTDRVVTSAGFSFTHFSNGTFSVPNLGINMPSFTLGLSYYIGGLNRELKQDSARLPKKNYEITFVAAGGLKSVYPSGSPEKYPAFSLATTFGTFRSRKGKILPGFDLFYNTALFDYYRRAKITIDQKTEMLQPGVSMNFIANIGKVSMMGAMGIYIYSKYKFDGPFYHRLGMRYHFTEHIFASASVKTHFFKADFLEWGIGYKLSEAL